MLLPHEGLFHPVAFAIEQQLRAVLVDRHISPFVQDQTLSIVDAGGTLQFKYLGQNIVDRPEYDYLFMVLEVLNGTR